MVRASRASRAWAPKMPRLRGAPWICWMDLALSRGEAGDSSSGGTKTVGSEAEERGALDSKRIEAAGRGPAVP